MKKILIGLTIGLSVLGITAFTASAFFPNMIAGGILTLCGVISTISGLLCGWIAGGMEQKEIEKRQSSKPIEISDYNQENKTTKQNTCLSSKSASLSKNNDLEKE